MEEAAVGGGMRVDAGSYTRPSGPIGFVSGGLEDFSGNFDSDWRIDG
jgi:hypothetical protein